MSYIELKKRNELEIELLNTLENEANVFFSKAYHKKNGKIVYLKNDKYIIPISIQSKAGFKMAIIHSEMFRYCDKEFMIEEEKQFLNSAVEYISKNKLAHWINVTPAYTFFSVYPDKSERIKFGSHVIDLTSDEETLFSAIKSKHRNMIRRAEKNGVYIKVGGSELLDEYLKLDKEMWERNGRNSNNEVEYRNALEMMVDNAFVAIAYLDGQAQSGMLCYYNKKMMYYMYAASKTAPTPGATNYLHWEVMKMMKEKGVKKYSFVGCRINEDPDSKYHNIQRFKAGFGGELVEGYLFRVILNKFMYKLFKLIIVVRTGRKIEDVIDQEIHKWKEIN